VATVNFSVPEEVKKAFDRAFRHRNKSAIIADLMRQAVADEGLRKQRQELFRILTERRKSRPTVTSEQVHEARIAGRP
jgi:metal-responsive CopG/Arc/MetJ family transcriptional regulator